MAEHEGGRRADLLTAAARCFVRSGLRGTTMEDIAREAGAGKATLYRYFSNKDAVIDALLEREARRLERELRAAADGAEDAPRAIEAAFVRGVGFFLDHPVLTRGRDEEPGLLLPRITANQGPLVEIGLEVFADVIARGVEAGELRRVDARAAAEAIVRLLLSYFAFPPMEIRVEDPREARRFARGIVAASLASRSD